MGTWSSFQCLEAKGLSREWEWADTCRETTISPVSGTGGCIGPHLPDLSQLTPAGPHRALGFLSGYGNEAV